MCSVSARCEKCDGAAEPAARMISFEYLGHTVRCLRLFSSCVVCGHHWEDDAYEHENEQFMQEACSSILGRFGHQDAPTLGELHNTSHR